MSIKKLPCIELFALEIGMVCGDSSVMSINVLRGPTGTHVDY